MREPGADREYVTPESTSIPLLIQMAKAGKVVPLSEDGVSVAVVVPVDVARAGLAALGRRADGI
jgi:antitoxin (DNA-binding transcriptional repressor) of toxin-antitoxin stability system